MKRTRLPILALCSLLAAPAATQAQSITSDRPGIGSGATVLASGLVHLETGISRSSASDLSAFSIGEMLVRVGFGQLELELFGNSYVVARSDAFPVVDEEGFLDFGFGVKAPLVRADKVNLSIQGILTAPTGSDAFTNDEWVGTVNALADVTLSDRAGLGINLGVQEGVGGSGEVVSVIITPGVSLGSGLGVYGGWAGFFADGGDTNIAEAGLTYLVNPDVQLDLNSGFDLDTDAWFFGGGVAVRWGAR